MNPSTKDCVPTSMDRNQELNEGSDHSDDLSALASNRDDSDQIDGSVDEFDAVTEDSPDIIDDEDYAASAGKKNGPSFIGLWVALLFFCIGGYFHAKSFQNKTRLVADSLSTCSVSIAQSPPSALPSYISSIREDLKNGYAYIKGSSLTKSLADIRTLASDIVKQIVTTDSKAFNAPSQAIHQQNQKKLKSIPKTYIRTSKIANSNVAESKLNISTLIGNVISKRRPHIVSQSSEILSWKALNWSLKEFSNHFGYLDQVLTLSKSNDFYYSKQDNQRKEFYSKSSDFTFVASNGMEDIYTYYHASNGIENLPIGEFFVGDSFSQTKSYLFHGNYPIIEEIAALKRDTTWEHLRYSEELAVANNLSTNTSSYLTFLYPHTALQARYSEYHNVRVQLKGVGSYYIIDPDYAKDMHLFPSVHAAASQAQVDLYDQSTQGAIFRSSQVSMAHAYLHPGEILYIPPFSLVHSEAQGTDESTSDESISAYLDVLSPSLEQFILSEAGFVQAKFGNLESTSDRVLISQIYLVHVLSRVQGIRTPQDFARLLYSSRYSTLFGFEGQESLWLATAEEAFTCYKDQPELTAELLTKVSKEHITKLAELIADALNDPAIRPSIRMIWLSNYVEHVAVWAMENIQEYFAKRAGPRSSFTDTEKAVLFIRQCLDFDKKLEITVEEEGPPVIKLN